jgi:hypothetical protein
MFFGWMLNQSRIHMHDVLLRKIQGHDPLEAASHMALHCLAAASFWAAVGDTVPPDAHVRDLLPMPLSVVADTAPAGPPLLLATREATECRRV